MDVVAPLRGGVRSILAAALTATANAAWPRPLPVEPGAVAALTERLERAVYDAAKSEAQGPARAGARSLDACYTATTRALSGALPKQVGPFPEDVPGLRYLRGAVTAAELVAEGLAIGAAPEAAPDPRELICRMFVRALLSAHERYAGDRGLALATARAIEKSCYNATVRTSKAAENPPRRGWDAAAFVDIYSTRCGAIVGLLDPASSACRAYGATLAARLLSGELQPAELGDRTEKELCPQATAAERAEIAQRQSQHVTEKESNLFACPHCGERRCKYREIQRRSLDEAPDYLCLCLACLRRFTGHS